MSDEWVEAEDDLADNYARKLAESMRKTKDGIVIKALRGLWGMADPPDLYEEDFPRPDIEDTK